MPTVSCWAYILAYVQSASIKVGKVIILVKYLILVYRLGFPYWFKSANLAI